MSALEFLLAGTLAAALPLLLAALGEMVVERTGVLNLGLEGMMALGAVIAFICVYHSGSHILGFAVAALVSAAFAMIFAGLVLGVRANEVAAGLAIGVLGLGLSALFGKTYESQTIKGLPDFGLPLLSNIPVIGPTLLTQDLVVWLTIIGTVVLWYVLNKTKLGLIITAVGENSVAARAIGYPVVAIRCAAVAFGGAMCGLAGAYAATVYTPLWADGMIAGRGWIALALVVFGTWQTGRVAFGAVLFGLLSIGQLSVQAMGVALPSQLLSSLPYLATILMLVVISRRRMSLG
ncbi:MAG: ABC transporter permease [Rhodobacteraceae bacterium]|nr:ABC transporter permease [Paracoccaceae bacterium]MCF8512727.1 ABC transporter permease [Paracoccaceae bacterium]MCF8516972.1 ABC transporter permease [Paracoccaceae bacterium]